MIMMTEEIYPKALEILYASQNCANGPFLQGYIIEDKLLKILFKKLLEEKEDLLRQLSVARLSESTLSFSLLYEDKNVVTKRSFQKGLVIYKDNQQKDCKFSLDINPITGSLIAAVQKYPYKEWNTLSLDFPYTIQEDQSLKTEIDNQKVYDLFSETCLKLKTFYESSTYMLPGSPCLTEYLQDEISDIKSLVEFAYQDQEKEQISILSFYISKTTGELYIAKNLNSDKSNTFVIQHPYDPIDDKLKDMIGNKEIFEAIKDKCHFLNYDVIKREDNIYDVNLDDERVSTVLGFIHPSYALNRTFERVHRFLYNKPSPYVDKELFSDVVKKEDKARTLFFGLNISESEKENFFSDWDVLVPNTTRYLHGMLDGNYRVDRQIFPYYELRFNFIYKDNDNKFASYGFFLDPVENKCFLICCHDPIKSYEEQEGIELYPLDDNLTDAMLSDVIKNKEVEEETRELIRESKILCGLAERKNLKTEEYDDVFNEEIKERKLRLIHDVFKLQPQKPLVLVAPNLGTGNEFFKRILQGLWSTIKTIPFDKHSDDTPDSLGL